MAKKSAQKTDGSALSPSPNDAKRRARPPSHRYKWCFIVPSWAGKRNAEGRRDPVGVLELGKCLDSIAAQTDPDCRVIIVNDGNSAEMMDLADRFRVATPDIPITYYQAPYRGQRGGHESVNLALTMLPGDVDFVTILNMDNRIYPEYIEKMWEQREHDIITCMCVMGDLPGITLSGRSFARGRVDRLNYAVRASIARITKHKMHIDADCDFVLDCLAIAENGVGHVFEELAYHK